MTTILLAALLTILVWTIGWRLERELREVRRAVEANTDETRELRLNARTRIAQASVRSGEASMETQLSRLGRASAARRIVVGGDDDSEQKQRMTRASRIGQKRGGQDDRDGG